MSFESPELPGISVPFSEVVDGFKEAHSLDEIYNQWGLFNLEAATAEFGDTWVKRTLSRDEVMNIVLPSHWHPKDKGMQLVPDEGMTVEGVAKRFEQLPNYGLTNPSCYRRIRYLRDATSPFYLSTQPISSGDYLKLDHFKTGNHLYHLDGLHRLVARASIALFSDEYLAENPVVSYIAGEQ